MRRRGLSPTGDEVKDWHRRYCDERETLQSIANSLAFRPSPSAIRYYMVRAGLLLPDPKSRVRRHAGSEIPIEKLEEAMRRYDAGEVTQEDVAREFRCNRTNITNRFARLREEIAARDGKKRPHAIAPQVALPESTMAPPDPALLRSGRSSIARRRRKDDEETERLFPSG